MTPADLDALAESATQPHAGADHADFVDCEACMAIAELRNVMTPQVVLALTRALRAAKDRRKYVSAQEVFVWAEFDAELADLEKL